MSPTVFADLRCLQDPLYQGRGIGQHVASILRSRVESGCATWTVVGLVDDSLGELARDFVALVDEVTPALNASISRSGAIFLDCSPMTHDPRFTLPFIANANFLKAAIVYDFIPMDRPGYLPTQAARIDYLAKLARLRSFSFYLPISHYSSDRLFDLLGVSRRDIAVTGASVRSSLYRIRDRRRFMPSPYERPNPYFFSLGGGDRRKNTEAAVEAVRRFNETQPENIVLKLSVTTTTATSPNCST